MPSIHISNNGDRVNNDSIHNKHIYKCFCLLLAAIPSLKFISCFLYGILNYYDIDSPSLNYIGGVSLFTWLFIFLASYVFNLSSYQRTFLYATIIIESINIIDYEIGIPISDHEYMFFETILNCTAIAIALYQYLKAKKKITGVSDENYSFQNKNLYKVFLIYLKIIPILLSSCCILNTTLSYYAIETPIFSILGETAIPEILLIYIATFVFRFCSYHRMFLYFLFINNIINIYDFEFGIKNIELLMLVFILYGITLFATLTMYLINKRHNAHLCL